MSLILLKEIKKKFKLKLTLNFSNINIKEILKYGFFVLLGGASAMLVSKLDMMMIAKFLSLEQVAYYSIAFYMGNAIGVPARAIGSISAPLLARLLKDNNIKEINIIV
jgi:O-antigen/teichoic acid export membrane protein